MNHIDLRSIVDELFCLAHRLWASVIHIVFKLYRMARPVLESYNLYGSEPYRFSWRLIIVCLASHNLLICSELPFKSVPVGGTSHFTKLPNSISFLFKCTFFKRVIVQVAMLSDVSFAVGFYNPNMCITDVSFCPLPKWTSRFVSDV